MKNIICMLLVLSSIAANAMKKEDVLPCEDSSIPHDLLELANTVIRRLNTYENKYSEASARIEVDALEPTQSSLAVEETLKELHKEYDGQTFGLMEKNPDLLTVFLIQRRSLPHSLFTCIDFRRKVNDLYQLFARRRAVQRKLNTIFPIISQGGFLNWKKFRVAYPDITGHIQGSNILEAYTSLQRHSEWLMAEYIKLLESTIKLYGSSP